MKIKILGTEYEIVMDAEEKDYPKIKGLSGYTDFSIKKIVIRKIEEDDASVEDLEHYRREVIRHEIIHAFFYESGLDGNSYYARNEELIDWIAIQFEKMLGVFIEVGAISSIGIDINVYDRTSNNPINDPINPPNDPINPPKVKEAKACIKLPKIKPVEIKPPKTTKDIVDMFNKAMENEFKGYIVGGDR